MKVLDDKAKRMVATQLDNTTTYNYLPLTNTCMNGTREIELQSSVRRTEAVQAG